MSDVFDPYHKWLAIPPEEQPANHYRLLGVRLFEDDADVIETSADRQMGHVRRFATGQRGELSQKLLNEISAAKVCLLNPAKRTAYDAALKAKLQAAAPLPSAQVLPTAQALPMAQALPQSARASNPQLRTRDDQAAQPANEELDVSFSSGSSSSGSTSKRRKKKSSPVLAVVALLAGAALIIGVAAVVLKKPAQVADSPNPVKPPPVVIPPQPPPNILIPDPDKKKKFNAPDPNEVVPVTPVSTDAPIYTPGKAYNLLTNFDLQKNVIAGEGWQFENNALTMPASDNSRVQSRVALPDEYMLAMVVERLSGDAGLYLGLPLGEGEISASIDNTHKDPNNVAAGIFTSDGADLNVTREGGQRLVLKKPVQVLCVVRQDNVQLSLGGKILATWKPDGRPLPAGEYWKGRDPRHLVIGGYRSSFKISRLQVMPIEPRKVAGTGSSDASATLVEGSPIDLLAGLDVEKSVVVGEGWSLKDGVLTTGTLSEPQDSPNARIQLPNQLPKEYTLTVDVERVSGDKDLLLGLPSPVGQMYAIFDFGHQQQEGRPFAGFYDFSAKAVQAGENNPPLLPVGKSTQLKCTIRKDGSTLEVDGRQIAFWRHDGRELSEIESWSGPLKNLMIVGVNQSVFKITKLELQSLELPKIAVTPVGTDDTSAPTKLVSGKPVDLLTGLDLQKAVVGGGPWALENGVLKVPEGKASPAIRMQFPDDMPTEYALSMIVERTSDGGHNGGFFQLGLPTTSGIINCPLDSTYEQPAGKYLTGFVDAGSEQPLAFKDDARVLPLKEPVEVVIVVRESELTLSANGKVVARWKPDGRKFKQSDYWSVPSENRLMLGSFEGSFNVSRLEFKPIKNVAIASVGNGNGPDTEKIVEQFGKPILEGEKPASDSDDPITNNPGTGNSLTNRLVEKVAPPTTDKQKETLATIKELFPDEYSAAKTPSTKLELGKKLLDTARSTKDDSAALYVLLVESLNYTAESGNAEAAMQALTMLERAFTMDVIGMSVDTFGKLQKAARQNEEHQAILRQVRLPIAAAVNADRYDEADKLLKVAMSSARALKDSTITKEVTASSKLLRDAMATYDKVKASREKLEKNPKDAAASTEWGRYLCLVKNNFAQGLPLLAQCSDAKLQEAAKLDLTKPREGKEQVSLGDKWYSLADNAEGMDQSLLRLRAEYWYRKGVSDLSGLEKTRIDKRLKDIAEIDRSNLPAPQDSSGVFVQDGQYGPPSMLGYCFFQDSPLPILFTYRQGEPADGAAIRNFLTSVGVPAEGNIQINLVGALELPQQTRVGVRLVGGSSSGGVVTLYYNDRRSIQVGDDRYKDNSTSRTLSAGLNLISVQIVGGDIGSFQLECYNEDTREVLPLKTELANNNLAKFPFKRRIDLVKLDK